MKVNDFYNEVSRLVDTGKTQINVADTKRVLACAFDVLAKMESSDAVDTLAKALALAKKRQK
ncbi:hypothetical protein [Lignipirellula cremea]|uniref:Uncharacterized protein n=1 Tax=Lignipirellula cremea TaxID=2528010 RepID=A0A518DSB9_9BACT|nr:hypothetical protein [Lignipirellula cremea]QDU94733.1 hypothetical protein Pla8534_25390 [Lignipirellula cremea]